MQEILLLSKKTCRTFFLYFLLLTLLYFIFLLLSIVFVEFFLFYCNITISKQQKPTMQTTKQISKNFSRTCYIWTSQKELAIFQTIENNQKKKYRVDFETKLSIIATIIAAIDVFEDNLSESSQIKTKVEIFKKDLKN